MVIWFFCLSGSRANGQVRIRMRAADYIILLSDGRAQTFWLGIRFRSEWCCFDDDSHRPLLAFKPDALYLFIFHSKKYLKIEEERALGSGSRREKSHSPWNEEPSVCQQLFYRLLEVSTGSAAIRVPVISLPRSKVDRISPGKFYMIFSELIYDTCNPLFQLGHKGVDS